MSENTNLLAGRSVVITGASGGVGEGMARACAAHGANVVIAARRLDVAQEVAESLDTLGGKGLAVRCDVTDRADVDATIDATIREFGRLDCFIHNAVGPLGMPGPMEDIPSEIWDGQLSVAVRASYYSAQASFEHLAATRGSFVLLVSSAGIEGSANIPAYAVVKGGVRGLAKSLAREWGPSGVRVNCMAPVAMTPALDHAFTTNPAMADRVISNTPMRRVGDPETDIGGVAVFLASDLSRFVTGQTLICDGGYSTMF